MIKKFKKNKFTPLVKGQIPRTGLHKSSFKKLCIFLLTITFSLNANAIAIEKQFDDKKLEKRTIELFKDIRCMVCTGESIYDSQSDLAKDLRKVIREKITQGQTDKQILDDLTIRYGNEILMTPPINQNTALLWASPALFIFIGLVVLITIGFKRKNHSV